ncbi:MAG: guanylate kinase [Atribacterota bacterium]|nr:guanylate kinase [Atribacterota bacterium]MDD4896077.1 guanylate kinase [Atribacterota bacterium]MDD5636379.1 guanylate kinase [Atribacterota bacterium]
MEKYRGHLFVISGPSGVGKGTLRKKLFEHVPDLQYSVSVTTRKPRREEREGIDYFFVDEETFRRYIQENRFAEWAKVHGDCKGTLLSTINKTLVEGKDLLLEIDVQGALQIKNKYPEGIFIFIAPPSWDKLENRLRGRSTEDEENLKKRLNDAHYEMEYIRYYDYIIVNNQLGKALEELKAIIVSERCRIRENK